MKYWLPIFVLLSLPALAANHYVCPGATGANTGADWTNAYTGIGSAGGNVAPGSMVRGDTYLIANGQVGSASSTINFNAADSGTSVITVQKATDASHGTSTGWTSGGTGACNANQAIYGPLTFGSDYWTFNGVHRGNGTGSPWLDWRTNYGFSVVNNNGHGVPINAQSAVNIDGGNPNNNTPFNHITFEYTQVAGSQDTTGTYSDNGIQISGGQSTGNYVGFNYVYGVGTGFAIDCDSCNSFTEEYNWVQNNEYTASKHSEIFAIRCWIISGTETNNGVIIRYNYAENSNSTAMIATPCSSDIHASNWQIYGNVFLYNQSEILPGYVCSPSGTECGNGDGWLSIWNFGTFGFGGYLYVFNNTISTIDKSGQGVSGQGGSCHHDWGGISGATMGTVAFYNNVYYNCKENITPPPCPGSCSSYTEDYNSYFGMTETNDHGAHVQGCTGACTSQNPFINVGQSANQNNFALAGASDPTTAWFNTGSLVAGNNLDLLGNTRISSRGALQFQTTPPGASSLFNAGFNQSNSTWCPWDGNNNAAFITGYRIWDDGQKWGQIQTTNSAPNFAGMDNAINTRARGNNTQSGESVPVGSPCPGTPMSVIYTFGDTPQWASAGAIAANNCASPSAQYSCTKPASLNNDGTGTDVEFATIVADTVARYAGKITYYEVWNEADSPNFWCWNDATACGGSGSSANPVNNANVASLKNLVRMAWDLKSIVACGDPAAKVLSPSFHVGTALTWFHNYNITSISAPAGVSGVNGVPTGCNWNAATVTGKQTYDYVNVHARGTSATYPTAAGNWNPAAQITAYNNTVTECTNDSLPNCPATIFNDEFGYNSSMEGGSNTDGYSAYVAQAYVFSWSLGVTQSYWYQWDTATIGLNGAVQGTAYDTVAGWLTGATLTSACAPSGALYECGLTKGGITELIVWDTSKYAQPCCTAPASQTYSASYTNYIDLAGVNHGMTGGVALTGWAPILLQQTSTPPPTCPSPYPSARCDLATATLPSAPPQVGPNTCAPNNLQGCGNLTGAGMCVTDPNFSSKVCRLTDSTTDLALPYSLMQVASSGSGDENHFNCDNTKIILGDGGGRSLPMTFTLGSAALPMYTAAYPSSGFFLVHNDAFWGHACPADNNFVYGVGNGLANGSSAYGSKLGYWNVNDPATPPTFTQLFDFTSSSACLGSGYTVTWSTGGESDQSDTDFAAGFSNVGGQGTGVDIAVWRSGSGCRHLNTSTLAVTGDWGPTGTIPSVTCTGTVHNVKIYKVGGSSGSLLWAITGGSSGCAANTPYIWNYGAASLTGSLTPACTSKCSGHFTEGLTTFANTAGGTSTNPNGNIDYQEIRTVAASPFAVTPALPTAGYPVNTDSHEGWNSLNDTLPFCGSTATTLGQVITTAWQDEIWCFNPAGTSNPWRIGSTFNTGVNQNFGVANAIGSVSPGTASLYAFTSDWENTLGATNGAGTCVPNGAPWQATTAYGPSTILYANPTSGNAGNFTFRASSGTTGGIQPGAWNQSVGGTTTSGTVTFTNIGGPPNCRGDVFAVQLLPQPTPLGTLTVTVSPSSSGTITSTPSGISCPPTCSRSFTSGTVMSLAETPAGGFNFVGWGGQCTGSGACGFTMSSAPLSVTATFAPPASNTVTVTITPTGGGTVTSSPAGINCPGTCSAAFTNGTAITLTAVANSGFAFSNWSGACSGVTCNFTMGSSAVAATAAFTPAVPSTPAGVIVVMGSLLTQGVTLINH